MNVVSKIYSTIEGQLGFEFYYDPVITELSDFEITNIDELKYGYDSANPKEISIYPSNIDVVIDDFNGDNYKNLKKLYEAYSPKYPFNFYTTFYALIKLNGTVIFNGIIDEIESDHENKSLTITFVDGVNKYKDVQISNPDMLDELYERGMVPRISYYIPGTLASNAYAYGFNRVRYIPSSILPNSVDPGGYIIDQIGNADKTVSLPGVIRELVKILRPGISVEFNSELKFGDAETPIDEMMPISTVWVKQIMQYLFGRYFIMPKVVNNLNQIGYLVGNPEYTKPDYFKVVYEDYRMKVFSHTYSGDVSESGSTFEVYKGIDEKTIAEILKVIAKNLFSFYGLKSFNTFFFKHKRYSLVTTDITDRIISMQKGLTIDKVDYVKIQDYFTEEYGYDGSNYNNDNTINYKIPLNAVRTASGGINARMLYYDLSGNVKDVDYFYDPVTGYRDIPQEVISRSEWESHKTFRDQYEFELTGIDFEFDGTYSVRYENYTGKFRPIALKKNLLESKTTMTALEIG